MLTSNVSQDRTIPYWDEIRNLSIEDKYSLIAKIESSLGDVDMSESTNSIHGIPREVMIAAAEYALKENRAVAAFQIRKLSLLSKLKEDGSSLVRLGFDAVR